MLLQGNCIHDRKCKECTFCEECVVQRIYYHKLKIVPDFVQKKESLGYLYECSDRKTEFHKGDHLNFQMTLFGDVIVHFPVILQAIYRLGLFGIGKENAKFQVIQIENQHKKKVFLDNNVYLDNLIPDTILQYVSRRQEYLKKPTKIRFITPLTQKYEGVFLKDFQEDAIVDSIYRRIYLLNCMEGNPMDRRCPFRGGLKFESQGVREIKIPRYSSTIDSIIYLKGIEGQLEIKQIKEEFLPYLFAGELSHIGKSTTMGFGQYRIS